MKKYGRIIPLVKLFDNRHSLFIMAGDIGTGKTTLAENFGDYLARKNNINISLFSLSLKTRGSGGVGEMTQLILMAFTEVKIHMQQLRTPSGSYASACILLVDEADSLAQSRELKNMQHEDRAGVNGLIQGLDALTKEHIPVIIIFCTNRLSAIDPAVRRRAAAIFNFVRPTQEQRCQIFKTYLDGANISALDMDELARATGENDNRKYGYTYSDLIQFILPTLLLDIYPDQEITKDKILDLLQRMPPTPPFNEQ
jgi:SpoVK/Ycf46/Vps4 family AAA+-type ATPase